MVRLILLLATLLFLAGCIGIHPADRSPATRLIPEQWNNSGGVDTLESDWWHSFNSSQLNSLLDQATTDSPDFAILIERMIQAELQLQTSGASLLPTLNSSGSTSQSYRHVDGNTTSGKSTSLSLSASYEIDLFGRVAAEYASAKASFRATEYELEATRLSLRTAIATAYFQQLVTNERLAIARENLVISERVLAVVENRLRFGSATQLDFDRQLSTVISQQASILTLEEQLRQLTSAVGILAGQTPQQFSLTPEAIDNIRIPAVAPYLPSELLLRRPDLARAEALIEAADANVAAARAALFPSLNLSSSLGIAGSALLSLSDPTTSASLGVGISQALFDGGKRKNQLASAQSKQREAVENYRKTILTTLKEVEDALDRVVFSVEQQRLQDRVVTLAEGNLRRAEHRYREGADELINLLDTQRSLFSAREQQIQLQLAQINASLDLYKVLGGGWKLPPEATSPTSEEH